MVFFCVVFQKDLVENWGFAKLESHSELRKLADSFWSILIVKQLEKSLESSKLVFRYFFIFCNFFLEILIILIIKMALKHTKQKFYNKSL